MSMVGIPEELLEFIREEAERADYDLVDISARRGNASFLEIVIDKKDGVSLDECSDFNRKITSWIEDENLFGGNCTLDVCSPGLDRELKSDGEFLWAVGRKVKVMMHKPVDGRSAVTGTLVEANEGKDIILEEDNGSRVCIGRANVAKAKLWVTIK